MAPHEIEEALKGMVVLVDTREQDTARLRVRLKDMKCEHERCKLDFGDYSAKVPVNGEWLTLNVAIERKTRSSTATAAGKAIAITVFIPD